ncbi:MAG: T9SS type A sorting domain-containing protein [Bacteroidetes bacterium]|nr:T9SS type A sorting domain-containing protein [Bacteroidota bacterium]
MHYKLSSFIALIILFSCFSGRTYSQAVLYHQNFEDTAHLFQGYVLANFDKGIPAKAADSTLADSAWLVRYLAGENTHAAIATSNYDPAIPANDWFVTPAIFLGKASHLSFKSMSLTNGKPDDFEVYISTSTQSPYGCLVNVPVLTIHGEQSGAFQEHEISLKDAGYANQQVYVGFRLNTVSDGDYLAIDDIQVMDDSVQSLASLTFKVNMSKYITAGNFHPRTDTVDIAGDFNGWDGTLNIMSLVPNSDSSIYSTTIPGFIDGREIQFKFRINSSWSDTALEFPYGGPNRIWLIEHDKYTYSAFYNEEGVVSAIPEPNLLNSGVSVFPNPFMSELTVIPERGIMNIKLVDMHGRVISEYLNPTGRFTVETSNLPVGMYVLLCYDRFGSLSVKKVIKK